MSGLAGVRFGQGGDANKHVVFFPDGKTLAHAGFDRAIHLWDVATGRKLRSFVGHTGSILAIDIAPNGKMLASASADTTVLLWDISR
jgi:WD40 repeat protein